MDHSGSGNRIADSAGKVAPEGGTETDQQVDHPEDDMNPDDVPF